ncbi:hypothetical protein PGT21_025494 [Puccinia graminis f. sp. tritici]|uniref:Uncharacterized protein n=1 Tax=Puccinia graminis f. sp. tritici TaxID=56615 RepID=A0A5B0MG09_PUCGR|nr:hypothetical protein PGT21_025494 [Puccinia graminis f. sp. tritici]
MNTVKFSTKGMKRDGIAIHHETSAFKAKRFASSSSLRRFLASTPDWLMAAAGRGASLTVGPLNKRSTTLSPPLEMELLKGRQA